MLVSSEQICLSKRPNESALTVGSWISRISRPLTQQLKRPDGRKSAGADRLSYLGMSEKRGNFTKYVDHKFAKYAAKICGNGRRLHIHINLIWYVFGGWDSAAVI